MNRLLIFSKVPVSGSVKTRLAPPLTYDEAAALSAAFLLDAVESWSALPGIDAWLYLAGADEPEEIERALPELFRSPLKERITLRIQSGRDLGERLHAAFEEAFADGCASACAIGSDHPTLPSRFIDDAFTALADSDLAIGPAEDGGYYLLGLGKLHSGLLVGLPYSSPDLFAAVMEAADVGALEAKVLPLWYDVDDAGSLERLRADRGALPEGSRTAGLLAMLDRRMEAETIEEEGRDER